MGGRGIDCAEDRLCAADLAGVGQASGSRCRARPGITTAEALRIKDLEREKKKRGSANQRDPADHFLFALAELNRKLNSQTPTQTKKLKFHNAEPRSAAMLKRGS